MEAKVLIPVIASVIAGLIALAISIINLRATKNLERLKNSYNLLSRDLEKLESIHFQTAQMILPSDATVETALHEALNEGEKDKLREICEDVNKKFKRAVNLILVNKSIYDRGLFDDIKLSIDKAFEDSNKDSHRLAYQLLTLQKIPKFNELQISKTRNQLSNNLE